MKETKALEDTIRFINFIFDTNNKEKHSYDGINEKTHEKDTKEKHIFKKDTKSSSEEIIQESQVNNLQESTKEPEIKEDKSIQTHSNIFKHEDNILIKDNLTIKNNSNEYYWNDTVLPLSYYLSKIYNNINKRIYLHKAEISENIQINSIKEKKFSELLTQIDILLIRNITPVDLIEYPYTVSNSINYLLNKNQGLINFISNTLHEMEYQRYFIKVMKYLKETQNYNSLNCIVKAFQRHKLSDDILRKISFKYRSYLEMKILIDRKYADNEIFIYPFDLFLKDIEDSNVNKDNEKASIKFCKLLELLVRLQNEYHKNKGIKINKKKEHFLYFNIYKHMNKIEEKEDADVCDDMIWLFL